MQIPKKCIATCLAAWVALSLPAPVIAEGVVLSKDALVACANAGVAECQFKLAKIVEEGRGAQQDTNTAKKLYELAYKNGYDQAGAELLRLTRADIGSHIDRSANANVQSSTPNPTDANHSMPIGFGKTGYAIGLGNILFDESEKEFLETHNGAKCISSGTNIRRCHAIKTASAVGVSVVFVDGKPLRIDQGLDSGCDELANALTERFVSADPHETAEIAADLGAATLQNTYGSNASITAWVLSNSTVLTVCAPSGSGVVTLVHAVRRTSAR